MYFDDYLYILDLTDAWKLERIKLVNSKLIKCIIRLLQWKIIIIHCTNKEQDMLNCLFRMFCQKFWKSNKKFISDFPYNLKVILVFCMIIAV